MTRREIRFPPAVSRTRNAAPRNAHAARLCAVPVRRVVGDDGQPGMSPPHGFEHLVTTIRLISRTARLMFSRQDPDRARALALELARSTSMASLDDPVRHWDPLLQTDRGLGHARRLRRLINSPVWQSEHKAPSPGTAAEDSAADYLFAGVMNLVDKVPLSDEAHLFRLWYLATRAAQPPDNATRLFGDLRELPVHQQLAAGARLMATVRNADVARSPAPAQHTV